MSESNGLRYDRTLEIPEIRLRRVQTFVVQEAWRNERYRLVVMRIGESVVGQDSKAEQ
jgi:hypothetical protein